MAVGIAIRSDSNVEYNGRITWFVLLSCIIAATGGLLFGYDTGITGGVTSMEPFLKKFFPEIYIERKEDKSIGNYCKFDSQLLTAFTSSLYISGLVASFFAAPITRAMGRRSSILIGGASFFTGAVLGGVALNFYMLIFGRLLLGAGIGFCNQSVPLYLSEIAPSKYRGAFNMSFQLCISIGTTVAFFINYLTERIKAGYGWRVSLALAAVPAALLTAGALFLPETPNSLIQHGQDQEKAKKILQKIRGTDDVHVEYNDLIAASNASKSVKYSFKKILSRKYRPQLVMSIAIPFFQQMTGINMITFYAPILFQTIGVGESASLLSTLIVSIIGGFGSILSLLVTDKIGRRILFQVGGVQMMVTQIVIGGIMAGKLGEHGTLSEGYGVIILIMLCLNVVGFGFSWGPLGWLIPSEIFPLEIRSAAQSINVAIGFLTTFIVSQTFLVMLCHFKSALFFFFAGWLAIMTVFVIVLLPETKDIPIERMDKIWREHSFWSRFVGDDQGFEENKIDEHLLYH